MITIRDLRKAYGQTVALDGVSLEVHPGETFGLLGPNGAGKTTTIQILCGLVRPDSGTVEIGGIPDPSAPGARLLLGVVPQSVALYEGLTAGENLEFFGHMYGLGGRELAERVSRCLDLAGLTDRRSARVGTFSGGMKRRLNFVCSLIHDPRVLLLDEPMVGVDPQSRNLLIEAIEALRAEGRTIIYTTHYMEEAERLCDRIAILDHGRVLDVNTIEGLVARYGGPARVIAELERTPPPGVGLPGRLEGTHLTVETTEPMETLARLNATGVRFIRLSVEQANLEDVFLNMTGRKLRDE